MTVFKLKYTITVLASTDDYRQYDPDDKSIIHREFTPEECLEIERQAILNDGVGYNDNIVEADPMDIDVEIVDD
jgi:hypothetical protein